jgi:hypothetical protein
MDLLAEVQARKVEHQELRNHVQSLVGLLRKAANCDKKGALVHQLENESVDENFLTIMSRNATRIQKLENIIEDLQQRLSPKLTEPREIYVTARDVAMLQTTVQETTLFPEIMEEEEELNEPESTSYLEKESENVSNHSSPRVPILPMII